jgi:hypothetical protein
MTAVLIYTRLSTEDVHDATVRQEVARRSYAEAPPQGVLGIGRSTELPISRTGRTSGTRQNVEHRSSVPVRGPSRRGG